MADRGDSLYFPMMVLDEDGERLVFFSDLAVPIFEGYFKAAGWDGERWHPPFITLDLRKKAREQAIVRTTDRRIFIIVPFKEIENGQEFKMSLFEKVSYKKESTGSSYFNAKPDDDGSLIHANGDELVVIEEKKGEEEI